MRFTLLEIIKGGEIMKRYGLLLIALAVMLIVSGINTSFALNLVPDGTTPTPCGSVKLQMNQGWFCDELAWFICTDTNDIRCAQTQKLNLAPRLNSALRSMVLAKVYIVKNFKQGPIFTSAPCNLDYSGLARVYYITWKPGKCIRPITNDNYASNHNENGIPKNDVCIEKTDIILNYPIVAIGQLGGPWYPAPPDAYRIPQGITHDPYKKSITLPKYKVFCSDPITQRVETEELIITDASNILIAKDLGANLAPGLLFIPSSDVQNFWIMKCPKPPSQLPIIDACTNPAGWRNSNFCYTPIMRYNLLNRYIQASAVVNNLNYLKLLLDNDGLTTSNYYLLARINAPMLGF